MPCCPEQEELQELVHAFVRVFGALEKGQMVCHGITPQQAYTLDLINGTAGVTMRGLSEKLGVATSTLTRNIEKLELDGLVSRNRSSEDARVVHVTITEPGMEKLTQAQGCCESYFSDIIGSMSSEERDTVTRALRILYKAVQGCCL